jgi:hypothetical protein
VPENAVSRYEPYHLRNIHFPVIFFCFIDNSKYFLLKSAHADVIEFHGLWQAEAALNISIMTLTHPWAPKRTTKDSEIHFVRVQSSGSLYDSQGAFAPK